jgi:hypothetical protein
MTSSVYCLDRPHADGAYKIARSSHGCESSLHVIVIAPVDAFDFQQLHRMTPSLSIFSVCCCVVLSYIDCHAVSCHRIDARRSIA